MGRSIFNQETQVRATRTGDYDDTLSAGSGLAPGTGSLLDDFNRIRSQVKRILDHTAGNWYDDVSTVNSKKRSLKTLNTDLDDLEEHRIICAVEKLEDITVPTSVQASGSVVAVAKANMSDGETLTLSDGRTTPIVFEFDVTGTNVPSGSNVEIDISGDTTAIQVATTMVSIINGVSSLGLTASNGGGTLATVTITHNGGGTHGNVTTWADTVVDAGFVVTQPTGGAGDVVVLNVASLEGPGQTAAVGTGTALGAVVASLTGDVGSHSLSEVVATLATVPKNRCLIRDAQLNEGISDSQGNQIYALIQAENGVVDGDTFNDTNKQVQLSFVVIDPTTEDLVPANGSDVGGLSIEYIYPRRVTLDTLPEDCNFPFFAFTDGSASVSVTLNNAIDNQGVTPATQINDIDIDMTGAGVNWCWRDALSADLFCIKEGSGTSASEIQIASDVDVFNVDAADNDFLQGATFDSGGTPINIGETAGQIDSNGVLTIASGGSSDLTIQAANEIIFVDTNKSGSTYSGNLLLSATQAEWDDFETAMAAIFGAGNGEVSLLKGITAAASNTRGTKVYSVYSGPGNLAANTDAGGPSSTANNLDTDLPNLSSNFTTDHDLYLNGELLRPGANASANHDYYPGTTSGGSGTQELKFEFKLKSNDQLCIIPYS